MKKNFLILFIFLSFIFISSCANPTPSLSSITPTSKVTHMPTFALTATGSGFIEDSVIVFNGQEKETTFVSETELTCNISPEDTVISTTVKTKGVESSPAETTVQVLIRNPSPGGGDSETCNFTIKDNHTFSTPLQVTTSFPNAVAANSALDQEGNLYLVIYKFNIPEVVIYYITSSDQGNTWSSPVRLTELGTSASSARLLIDDEGNMHFIYLGDEVYPRQVFYRRKLASESAWESKRMLSQPDSQEYGKQSPSIGAHDGHIFVFWNISKKNGEMPFIIIHSPDSGSSWSTPRKIGKFGDGYNVIGFPAISDAGTILFVYQSQVGSKTDIQYSTSADNGQTWSDPVMLSNGLGKSSYPRLLYPGTGQNISVVWTFVNTSSPSPFYAPFSEEFPFQSINPGENLNPDNNGQVLASGSFQLKMVSSQNLGGNWSGVSNIHTFSFYKNYYLLICTANCDSAGNFNLAWYDGLDENSFRIYYMRSINQGTTWTTPIQVWGALNTRISYINSDILGNLYLSIYKGLVPYSVSAHFSKSIQ